MFADGEYSPETSDGRSLLMHELVHVVQQSGGRRSLQRLCSHDGTPVNCHNWTLPLPPWIAGMIAQSQISAWSGVPAHAIPRASKVRMGQPSTPTTPWGFADLWRNGPDVEIGEIKSTATGSTVAGLEAAQYVLRHDESMLRGPIAPDDLAYLTAIGLASKPGALLDLSSRTSSGVAVGPFAGDPLKTLFAEADNLGAVVYWCTGVGAVNPLWLVLFKKAMDALKKQLQALKRMMGDVIDAVLAGGRALARWISDLVGGIVDWGRTHSRVLAFLALLAILLIAAVLLIISILAEAPSAGTSTAVAIPAVVALGATAAGIMLLFGMSSPTLPTAVETTASAVFPTAAEAGVTAASYDPPRDAASPTLQAALGPIPADPGSQLIAALSPLSDASGVAAAVIDAAGGSFDEAQGMAMLRQGIQALRTAGDNESAAGIESQMQANGLA